MLRIPFEELMDYSAGCCLFLAAVVCSVSAGNLGSAGSV